MNSEILPSMEDKELTKAQNLADYLVEAIVSGEIAAGGKISEPELARRFNVSRGPLREALLRVQGLGLIERIPHAGARVISLSVAKMRELYAVREALEGMAARLAARYISESDVAALKSLLAEHQQYVEKVEGSRYFYQFGDFDFHYRIIKASGNTMLISLLCGELYHQLRMYRHQSPNSHSRPASVLEEHKLILYAIETHDEELAEILMRRHIAGSRRLIEHRFVPADDDTDSCPPRKENKL